MSFYSNEERKEKSSYSIKTDVFDIVLRIIAVVDIFMFALYVFVFDITSLLFIVNNILFFFVTLFCLYLNKKGKNYRIVSKVFIAVLVYLYLPVFTTLGLNGSASTPFWFVTSIIVMVVILDKKDFWWMFITALYLDTYLFVRNCIWNTSVNEISNVNYYFLGYLCSFILLAVAIFVNIISNERNYYKIQTEIDKSREMEKNAGRSKSRFLSNMSNEIRTPMNSIIGLSELVLKEDMEEDARNEVDVIKKSAYDLLEIIDDVLMYAKLDDKSLKLSQVDFRFDDLLNQVIDSISSNIKSKELKVRIKIDHNIPCIVNGDDIRIKQVIMRLIFISLSLTDNGRLMLSVECERDDINEIAHFKLIVSDTGCGLSNIDIDAIKGAYDIYDSRQNSNLKGVALKFNICEELISLMGGNLSLQSIEGVGLQSIASFDCKIINPEPIVEIMDADKKHILVYAADNRELSSWKTIMEGFKIRPDYANSYFTFEKALKNNDYNYVFVPSEVYPSLNNIIHTYECEEYTYVVAYSNNSFGDFDKCRIIHHPVSCLTINTVLNNRWKSDDYIAKNDDTKYDGSAANILVVDDNAVNLKVASGIFKSLNITVDTANSGADAIEKLKNKEYHLVLMDMVMPEMSGTDTLRKMRNSDNFGMKNVPVVALTATSGGNTREEILEEGFQEYLAKPIKVRYLLQVLIQFLPSGILRKVSSKENDAAKRENKAVVSTKGDENTLHTDKGIKSLGDNLDAYVNVLNTYYKEGRKQLSAIPDMFEKKDISLFTTTVHGIKSSSATIGAQNLSEKFKSLEEYGKENDVTSIEHHLQDSLSAYKKILDDVRTYLESKGRFQGEVSSDNQIDSKADGKGEKVSVFTKDIVDQFEESINSMDFAETDKCFNRYLKVDFGENVNLKLLSLKEAIDVFDFETSRSLLKELLQDAS